MTDGIVTTESGANEAPVVEKKKRGRKPNPNKPKMYFSDREENAFREYILSEDETYRNKIFNSILYPAFTKMVESIIRKYTLFKPGEDFQDTFNDVMSHLISKVNKFDPEKKSKDGKPFKAYSYCGTVCKNYALHERQKAQDRLRDNISYEVVYNDINPDLRITNEKPMDDYDFQQIIMKRSANEIEKMLQEPNKHNLNDSDVKVGIALVNILLNWDNIFSEFETKKYNKSQVDMFIKEFTSLDGASGTKKIRDAKKKYAVVYYKLKEQMLHED